MKTPVALGLLLLAVVAVGLTWYTLNQRANAILDDMTQVITTPRPTAAPVEVPTEAPLAFGDPGSFDRPGDRELQRIVRNPARYAGGGYQVWACISQFDAATGDSNFLGYVSHQREDIWAMTGDAAWFVGEPAILEDVVSGDIVRMNVVVIDAYTYDTTAGGFATVPRFGVLKIERQRGSDCL